MDLFNKNNMSLCESICNYKGYVNEHIICECRVKIKFNSFLNVNVSKYDLIYRFEQSESKKFNFWVLKCYYNLFTKEVIMNNICSEIILGIIFINFIAIVIFCVKEHDMLNKKIFILIKLVFRFKDKYKNDINDINSSSNQIIKNNKNSKETSKLNKNNKANKNNKNNKNMVNNINNNEIKDINKDTDVVVDDNIQIYEERTDNELNYFPYIDAILIDRRTFFEIYLSLLKTKQILFLTFGCKTDFNPRTMKISFFLFVFSLFLVSNTIFINDSLLHKLYISEGNISILSDLPKILYATIISSTIKNLLLLISFPESDILLIRRNSSIQHFKANHGIQKSISMVIIRCYFYFLLSMLILFLFWIYIASFFMVFQNTQFYVIKNTIISFGISLVYPIILYIFPALIRSASLKETGTQSSYCFYVIATILQILL